MTPPLRFDPADRRDRLRIATARLALIGGAAPALTRMARSRPAGVRAAERRWARAAGRSLRVRLEVSGVANIDPHAQYLVAALHEGLFDPVALLHLPLDLRFLVRDEIFEWPRVGPYLAAAGHIRVDEGATLAATRRLFHDVAVTLAGGDSIAVFPQGSVLGLEVAFRPGVATLARRFGVPILPVVVTGSHRVWEYPFSTTVRVGCRVTMEVLPAVPPPTPEGWRDLEVEMKRRARRPEMAPPRRYDPERDGFWDGYRFAIDPDFPEVAAVVADHRRTTRP